jgi:hypothetical protein
LIELSKIDFRKNCSEKWGAGSTYLSWIEVELGVDDLGLKDWIKIG